ncbi:hypothetical protein AURDEDRAFT_115068 [Auricularia subglabra TFB-10046 SS5]|nr:hypothetical protein AURDEDRAFT_115068 [Auricularia subglabra TFB-10046 SS5]
MPRFTVLTATSRRARDLSALDEDARKQADEGLRMNDGVRAYQRHRNVGGQYDCIVPQLVTARNFAQHRTVGFLVPAEQHILCAQ